MADTCRTCRFWKLDEETRDPGDPEWGCGACRRDPPVLIQPIVALLLPAPRYAKITEPDMGVIDLFNASKHPATWSDDWCGRFERVEILPC